VRATKKSFSVSAEALRKERSINAACRYLTEFFLGRRAFGFYGNLLSSDNRGIIADSPAFVKGFLKKS
jgi:hypothetical protein